MQKEQCGLDLKTSKQEAQAQEQSKEEGENPASPKKQKTLQYLKDWIPYRYKRYIVYSLLTAMAFILPFVKIEGIHFFLLSFDKKQLHLLFTKFDMQELYLMPFLLIMLFLGIFFMTTLGGRVWCGWSCPQTIFRVIYRDLIETKLLGLRKNISNKQTDTKDGEYGKKIVAVSIWTALSLLAASNFTWYFVPPEDFFAYLANPFEHTVLFGTVLGLAAFFVYDIVSLKENFCIYICPYARVQSVMYDDDTIQTIYNPMRGGKIYDHETKLYKNQKGLLGVESDAECTFCESCVRVCPTHIDIRKGMQLECINCLECSDACTKVMGALGKPSLITWTSPNEIEKGQKTKYIRFRTIAYAVALSVAFAGLFFMGSKKESMLLNINRTTELYKIKDNGKIVENAYTFLFQNTDSKDHIYYFEILNNENIKILRPTEPFSLQAGQKAQKIVILSTQKELAKDDRKDIPVPVKIKAYATDEKERVWVERESVFIYPRYDAILKEQKR